MISRLLRLACVLVLMGGVVVGFSPDRARAADVQSDSVQVLTTYYSAIDAFDYKMAYAQFGSTWQKAQSYANFEHGFGNTAFVDMDVTSAAANGVVNVRLISWHNDGTLTHYAGSYTTGLEGGIRKIIAASIHPYSASKSTPPLCTADQLTFSFGAWDPAAGSRYTSLVAKNISTTNCVAGGAPRVIVTDKANGAILRSSATDGAAPDAITLRPGHHAYASVRLSNWCNAKTDTYSVQAQVPGDNTMATVAIGTGLSVPPCLGEGQAPGLTTEGFEAKPR
jgi:Protein of unknown function (DUF4232)